MFLLDFNASLRTFRVSPINKLTFFNCFLRYPTLFFEKLPLFCLHLALLISLLIILMLILSIFWYMRLSYMRFGINWTIISECLGGLGSPGMVMLPICYTFTRREPFLSSFRRDIALIKTVVLLHLLLVSLEECHVHTLICLVHLLMIWSIFFVICVLVVVTGCAGDGREGAAGSEEAGVLVVSTDDLEEFID